MIVKIPHYQLTPAVVNANNVILTANIAQDLFYQTAPVQLENYFTMVYATTIVNYFHKPIAMDKLV